MDENELIEQDMYDRRRKREATLKSDHEQLIKTLRTQRDAAISIGEHHEKEIAALRHEKVLLEIKLDAQKDGELVKAVARVRELEAALKARVS